MTSVFIFIFVVVFFVVALVIFSNLQNRINVLQQQMQTLKKRVDEFGIQKQTIEPPAPSLEKLTPKPESMMQTNPSISNQLLSAEQQPIEIPKATSNFKPITEVEHTANQQKRKPAPQNENDLAYRFIQWLIKGNPIAKVAIIILFFGLSYLLKYSIDHELLLPEIRVLGSLLLGIVLLTIGWKLRKKKELYALLLQGAAIGIMYLTLFAAYKLYALVPLLLTLTLLVVTCATSVMFAILQRAISLAVIACIGGYLAPILLSTGEGNHIALFSYYLLISSAILVISFWQSWRLLNLIGFIFTFVIAVLWGYRGFHAAFYLECQIFILANMLIYGVLAVLLSIRSEQKEPYQNLFDLILLFSVPITAFSLQYTITKQWQYIPAFSALLFGLFYLLGSFIVLRVWHHRAKKLAIYGLAIGLGFSTLAVPLALSVNLTALVWLVEGSAISCAALSQKQYRFGWIGATIVLLGTLNALFAGFDYISNTAFITLYGAMSIILLFNACLWYYFRHLNPSADGIRLLFFIISVITWSMWIIGSINRIIVSTVYILQPIIIAYVIMVWLWFAIGRKLDWPVLRYCVIALWPVLFFTVIINILSNAHIYYAGLWALSSIVAFISAYCYLYFNKNDLISANKQLAPILHISLLWIILAWLYHEVSWLLSFLPWGYEVISGSILTNITGAIIFGFYLLYKYRKFPMQDYPVQYWQIGLLPLGLYLLLKLITGLYSSGQIIYWTYIPFINLLEESAIFALIILALWLHLFIKISGRSDKLDLSKTRAPLFAQLLLITLIFLWSNSVILRSLSQWLDISWSFYVLWHNNIVQVVLSLIWTLTAVMLVAIAHRYILRNVWFTGAVLQIIVVLKLVLIDSVELDGLMRAFVFIGVALLMLVIGYLAPLPPKSIAHNQLEN